VRCTWYNINVFEFVCHQVRCTWYNINVFVFEWVLFRWHWIWTKHCNLCKKYSFFFLLVNNLTYLLITKWIQFIATFKYCSLMWT
jgi:hypothetical protein